MKHTQEQIENLIFEAKQELLNALGSAIESLVKLEDATGQNKTVDEVHSLVWTAYRKIEKDF